MKKYSLKKSSEIPLVDSINNRITDVNDEFIRLSGFSRDEIIGRSVTDLGCMLRVHSQVQLADIKDKCRIHFFHKNLRPGEVLVSGTLHGLQKTYRFFPISQQIIKDVLLYSKNSLSEMADVSMIYTCEGVVLAANDRFMDWEHGQNHSGVDLIGKTLEELYDENAYRLLYQDLEELKREGKAVHTREIKRKERDGSFTYWDRTMIPIYNNGKIKYIVHSGTDVTKTVLDRIRLEEQRQELEAIIQNMSDGVFLFDQGKHATPLNRRAREFLYNPESVNKIGDAKDTKYFDMDGKQIQIGDLTPSMVLQGETIQSFYLRVQRPDGEFYYSVSGSPIYDNDGRVKQAIVCTRDITEQTRYEENLLLASQYHLMNNIIEKMDLGCTIASYPDFKIKFINEKSYRDLQKINPEAGSSSVIGKDVFDIFRYKAEEKIEKQGIIKELEKSSSGFYETIHAAAVDRYYKRIYQPLYGLNNQFTDVFLISMDITDEVLEKNKIAETLRIQEEIFTNISHELKTPLSVIFSANQVLNLSIQDHLEGMDKNSIVRYTEIIRQNCYRFTKLINNIIDLSKNDFGYYKLYSSNENIVDIVGRIVESVREHVRARGLTISFHSDVKEKIMACDPEKIERILLNLITNAIKFSNTGKEISIHVADKTDRVQISVKDAGVGIDKEHLKSIFGRFYQVDKSMARNAEGSGIGLSLVKMLVELHGGSISVDSEIGKGSVFTVELPVKEIEHSAVVRKINDMRNTAELINIEFSDIYQND